jgi:hypothetical protein
MTDAAFLKCLFGVGIHLPCVSVSKFKGTAEPGTFLLVTREMDAPKSSPEVWGFGL